MRTSTVDCKLRLDDGAAESLKPLTVWSSPVDRCSWRMIKITVFMM